MKKITIAATLYSLLMVQPVWAMSTLSDEELSDTQGQALFNMSYLSPSDTGNFESLNNVGFYKLGVEAEVELNLNIKKLQLGCGGVNGANGCDIDIDNLSLSGLGNSGVSDTSLDADRVARAGSSAVLTNPFFELAIKNPNVAATRELVGVRLSAEKAIGLMTFGDENTATPNGINSLSGFMTVAATTGLTKVNGFGTSLVGGEPARGQLQQPGPYNAITGNACCLAFGVGNLGFTTTSYNLNLRDKATGSNILKGDLVLPQQNITGRRMSDTTLYSTATVRDIDLSGNLVAVAAGIINLDKQTTGTIKNLQVDATIYENLGLFHKASLNGSAVSLSLQGQDIRWPGAQSLAQRGWWLELSNPIDIGQIDPTNAVNIPIDTLNASMTQISAYLDANPVDCGNFFAINCLFGSTIPVGIVDLIAAQHAPMDLFDLQLAKQNFTPNCYGTLKFC
ncbi:MAG: hypothetical protein IPP76_12485 [Moraxellaceae bacterium]|nr:hypothetical protein [Moraxellaceae bacterium]